MTVANKQRLTELLEMSHLDFLQELLSVCDDADKQEVKDLIYLNDVIGIGWGDGNYTFEQEQGYFDRVETIIRKYDIDSIDYPKETTK